MPRLVGRWMADLTASGEPSVGRGAADRVVSDVNVDRWRPGQRQRSSLKT